MTVRILIGDCRERLRELPDESVHCVVTSPPYFGLRDYGTAKWEGGDNPDCDHLQTRRGNSDARADQYAAQPRDSLSGSTHCRKCGARRVDSQIGLEQTPDEFVAQMVAVFSDVRRVLKNDGVLWLNLGDSYTTGTSTAPRKSDPKAVADLSAGVRRVGTPAGLKPKDLIGIPWRVAFALQADGWWLRQDIIWSKPNPMPESVTDRCTKAHEYLFMLTKSARYHFDQAAILEPFEMEIGGRVIGRAVHGSSQARGGDLSNIGGYPQTKEGRNKRSVWNIATAPFSQAHFATFPPALVEPCILAGCPVGGTVLDPFGGAGTTGLVADRLQRNAILIELNPAYAEMAERRIRSEQPMLADIQLVA